MILTPDKRKLVRFMLDELKAPVLQLTAWEEKFRLSVAMQFDAKHWISEKQYLTLRRLYETKTA